MQLSFTAASNWAPCFSTHPAAGGLSHLLKLKTDDVTLVLKLCHWFLTHSGQDQILTCPRATNDPPTMVAALSTPNAGTWALTSPLPQCAQLQDLHLFLEQARHTPTSGPSPFPPNVVFLPQLSTWLPLTSDLLVSTRTSLKCLMFLYRCVLSKTNQ